MPDKKVEKALYGPSATEVALGALLGLVAGVALACAYLVWKPVQSVREMPKEEVKGVVYHLAGRTNPTKARGWEAKVASLTSGGTIVLNEEELNAWAASLGAPAAGKPAEGAAPSANEFLSATALNFRLEGERLHLSQKVRFNYFGVAKEVLLQAQGTFAVRGDTAVFVPEAVHLGSCPIHRLPGAVSFLRQALVARAAVSEDLRSTWGKVSDMAVEDALLRVTTKS